MSLLQTTEHLLLESNQCWMRFLSMRENDTSPDFFHEVKPHADEILSLTSEWASSAEKWIQTNRPKHIRHEQIKNAVESMNQFVVQSFYKETSKKRLYESIQSVKYTLETFLRYLKEEGDDYEL